ncbi:MAG: O-antigen ligase family protein [Phycisphaerales bacterium]
MRMAVELLPRWRRAGTLLRRPFGSLARELEEYDRDDPTRTSLLASIMAAWCASLSLARPLEAGLFSAAAFVAIYRLPATLRVVVALLRTPVALLVVAYLALTAGATMLSTSGWTWSDAMPKRMFVVPLLLAPVLPRWRLLIAGLVAGGLISTCYLAVAALLARGPWNSLPREPADGATVPIACAVVVGLAALSSSSWRVRVGGPLAAAAALSMQAQASMRAAVAGSLAGAATLLLVTRGRTRWTLAAILAVVAAMARGASLVLGGLARESMPREGVRREYSSLNTLSSNRLELWRLTLAAAKDHPLIGHGRKSWRGDIDTLRPSDGAIDPYAQQIWTFRGLAYGHNTPIDVLYQSGAVGLALLSAAAALVLRAAWNARGLSPCAALVLPLVVSAFAVAQFDFVFERSIPGAWLLTCACLAFAPALSRGNAPRGVDARLERALS